VTALFDRGVYSRALRRMVCGRKGAAQESAFTADCSSSLSDFPAAVAADAEVAIVRVLQPG
jgi:hypothetical protein